MLRGEPRAGRRVGLRLLLAFLLGSFLCRCSEPALPPAQDAGSTPAPDTGVPVPDAGEPPLSDAGEPLVCPSLVIDGVTAVDADGVRAGVAVLLSGDRIASVEPAGRDWPEACPVVDGRGRFLVPGLVDAHVHLTYAGTLSPVPDPLATNLRASLYHGVTTVMDVGAGASIFAVRDAVDEGRLLAPRIRATGPFFTAPGSHPCEESPFDDCLFVDPQNAAAQVAALAPQRPDALKVALADTTSTPWPAPRLDPAAVGAIVAAGDGLPVYAHVDSNRDLLDALATGVSVLAHPVFVEPLSQQALDAAAGARAVHSTLGAFRAAPDLVDGRFDPDAPGLIVTEEMRADWQAVRDDPRLLAADWLEATRAWSTHAEQSLLDLRGAGVGVIPGSDAGYLFVPHGLGFHQELGRLQALGFGPAELLAASTLGARRLLGLEGGRIAAGEPADLLLLGADPTLDVSALDEIELVVLAGRPLDRAEILATDLLTEPSLENGPCLEPADCAAGLACDRLAHLCRPACPTPYAVLGDCGPGAWCMPTDGDAASLEGVCRPEPACDLYAEGCGPGFYPMQCVPLDADTNACLMAGAGAEGEGCEYVEAGSTCTPGLYCSPETFLCYRLCDPQSPSPCPAPQQCAMQSTPEGDGWFGLCLP